jgi:hypothetical protein
MSGLYGLTDRREVTMNIRRIITAEGISGVVTQTDDIVDTSNAGSDAFDIWGFDEIPELPVRPEQVFGPYERLGNFGPLGAIRVDIIIIPPVTGDAPPELSETVGSLNLGTGGGMILGREGRGMHRADTVDLLMVLEGETDVEYPGEDGEEFVITIRAGDLLVQNGTFHRWYNRSGKNCTILDIPLAATRKMA